MLAAATFRVSSIRLMRWTFPDEFPAKTFAFRPATEKYAKIFLHQPLAK